MSADLRPARLPARPQGPGAGPAWIEQQQRTLNAQYDCGQNIYGWDGDTLAYETRYSDNPGERRLIHYFYEPGSFIPVAQTVENRSLSLVREPSHENGYHIDRDPLWQHQPVAKPFNAMAWYQCDHLGTPMELTDQRGEIAWSGTYQAWGLAKEKRTDSAIRENIRNPLRFQGQYFDTETGLHYNRYRYYDPQVGRFISKDPIGFAGGLNVYAYAPNPVGWVDPFGLARVYRNAPYHGATDNPIKSRAPSNGQAALDNSSQVKESSPRRIGVDIENNELVILDRTQVTPNSDEEYHGHVRCWCDLHTDQQNTLRRAQQVTSKGKIRRQP